jgi:hypothetical protein
MTNIEKLYNEWRAAQPINETLKRRMDQQFMIDFNYNSNHLEGNTLTYGQTELLLIFGKVSGEANMRDLEEMKAQMPRSNKLRLSSIIFPKLWKRIGILSREGSDKTGFWKIKQAYFDLL